MTDSRANGFIDGFRFGELAELLNRPSYNSVYEEGYQLGKFLKMEISPDKLNSFLSFLEGKFHHAHDGFAKTPDNLDAQTIGFHDASEGTYSNAVLENLNNNEWQLAYERGHSWSAFIKDTLFVVGGFDEVLPIVEKLSH